MLRRQRQLRVRFHKLVDAGLFSLALWMAHSFRSWPVVANLPFWSALGGTREIQPFSEFLWLVPTVFVLAPFCLVAQGFYNRPVLGSRGQMLGQLFRACVVASVTVILILFIMREPLSRAAIILFGAASFLLVFVKEELVRLSIQTRFGQMQFRKRLILVGTQQDTQRLAADLKENSHASLDVLAEVDLSQTSIDLFVEILHESSANGILLAAKHTLFDQIEKVIQVCELEGVEVWLVADFFKTQLSRTTIDELDGRPMLVFRSTPDFSWQGVAKQILDTVGALFFVLVGSIIMVPVAVLIKLTSPGPILFKQQRSGLNGQPFTMLKFRSMVTNAEQLQHEMAALNEMAGPVFKVTNDPRVTPIGRFIRRWSIDELPQLFNVLAGDMSLVGPRPLPVDETRRFDDLAHRRRLSVKPGLTCTWQISGRNNLRDFKEWVRLDLEYIDNWSLGLDFRILLLTIPVVFKGTGAR